MGVRENTVEKYLDGCIKEFNGLTRKWVSPGRDGVPDRIVIVKGHIWFVEVKTVDGKLSPPQIREHTRLAKCGAAVRCVWGKDDVDLFIKEVKYVAQNYT